ncbi:MAG: ATP synthase subunit I [Gammaproteobacteria bacterium]|nr:ATP synthase subunit I [Gammaproteobacteria bacterium]
MAKKQSLVTTILISQIIVACVIAIGLIYQGILVALSSLLGGFICIIPNIYLARKLAGKQTADVNQLQNSMYTAEIGKIIITAALFAGVFATQDWIHPVALLAGFGLAHLTHWLTPVVMSVLNKNRDL